MTGSESLRPTARQRRIESTELSQRQCANVTEAAWYAYESGAPLNCFITINWSTGRISAAGEALSALLKRAGAWLAARHARLAYVWVRETNAGDHVHILIHVPPLHASSFVRNISRWLKSVGAERREGVVRTRPVARNYAAAVVSPAYYEENLGEVLRYVLKGATVGAAAFTDERRAPMGYVIGQRAGVAHDLNGQARVSSEMGAAVRLKLGSPASIYRRGRFRAAECQPRPRKHAAHT